MPGSAEFGRAMLRMGLGKRRTTVRGALRIAAAGKIGRGPGRFCSCGAPLPVFSPGSRTRICLEKRKGEGLVNRQGGLHARRSDAGLDEMQEDPSDLGGIGDDGKHSHGGAAGKGSRRTSAAAALG